MKLFMTRLIAMLIVVFVVVATGTLVALIFSSPASQTKVVSVKSRNDAAASAPALPETVAMDRDDEIALISDAAYFRSNRRMLGNDMSADSLCADFAAKLDRYSAKRAQNWLAILRDIAIRDDGTVIIDVELLGQGFYAVNASMPFAPGSEPYEAIKEARVGEPVAISGRLMTPSNILAEPLYSTDVDFRFSDIKLYRGGKDCVPSTHIYCGG
jgi:hypothetical protein